MDSQLDIRRTPREGMEIGPDGKERPETADVLIERVLVVTEKAYRVVIEGAAYWLPKSQIVDGPELSRRTHKREVTVWLWWVKNAKVRGYM